MLDRFLTQLAAATTAFAVYPTAHPQCQEALQRVVSTFHTFQRKANEDPRFGVDLSEGVTLLVIEEDLVVLGSPWQRESATATSLLRSLQRSQVERLTLKLDAEADDFESLLRALGGRDPLRSTRRIAVSLLDILPGEGEGEGDTLPSPERASDRLLEALRPLEERAEAALEAERFLRVDRACWTLLESMQRHERTLLLHPTFRLPTDAFWRHGLRTALHSAALARRLGVHGNALADLALAGLLHDIGRLEVALLARHGQVLDPTRHVVLGSQRLASVAELPAVCALVAYEHHLHWNGSGGYPSTGRQPGLASQVVAVADAWDVVWSATVSLPHEQRLEVSARKLRQQSQLQPDLVTLHLEALDLADVAA